MKYRGYMLHYTTDGITIRWDGDLIEVASTMSEAKASIDSWLNAR